MLIVVEVLAVTIITLVFILGIGLIGKSYEYNSWEDKIKTQGTIEVDGKHYKIKEVVLFKTYKEK